MDALTEAALLNTFARAFDLKRGDVEARDACNVVVLDPVDILLSKTKTNVEQRVHPTQLGCITELLRHRASGFGICTCMLPVTEVQPQRLLRILELCGFAFDDVVTKDLVVSRRI